MFGQMSISNKDSYKHILALVVKRSKFFNIRYPDIVLMSLATEIKERLSYEKDNFILIDPDWYELLIVIKH